jgi:type I restriction enzyme S subunit
MYKVLSELVEINPRTDLPAGAGTSMKVSFIPMSDVTESGDWIGKCERTLGTARSGFTAFADGDVLVAKITPCFENGKGAHVIGLTNGIGFGSTEFHVLRARDGVSQRFIHHVTQSAHLRRTAEAFMSGSAGQRRVPSDFFERYLVPDFSFKEQDALGRILDTLDTTIRQTEAIIEKLKQIKQGLLHDLLTRGIDANGELRPPQSHSPHLYKDSPLGWIPNEWNIFSIGQIVESIVDGPFGSNLKTEHYVELPGVRVVRLQNIDIGEYDDTERAYVSAEKAADLGRNEVLPGDVLIAALGDESFPVGRACSYPTWLPKAINKADCFRLRPEKNRAIGEFVVHSLNGSGVRRQTMSFEQGVTLQRINIGNLRKIQLLLPTISEQILSCEKLAAIQHDLAANMKFLAKSRQQRSGLMNDLLTGRFRVTSLLDTLDA